jgi:hypothetical protein
LGDNNVKLCFLEGCNQTATVTVHKVISTRGQIGDSSCEIALPFCTVDHAAAFERLFPTVTEQMATIARFAANFEAQSLTIEQLEHAAESLYQIIDVNLGGQGMVIMAREEYESLNRSQRMLASTQRELNQLKRTLEQPTDEKALH